MEVLGVSHTAPSFAVPKGACDCHVHVFGPGFPFAAGRLYTPPPAPLEALEALHRALHFERVVIVQASPYGTDNSCLLDALARLGPRGRGVAVIDDATGDAALQAMHRAGVRGVRINLETAGQRDPAQALALLRRAAERAAPLGWHVQTYTNLAVIEALHDAILTLPTPIVVDHFGAARMALGPAQPGFEALLSLVRQGRAYVKISAAYRLSQAADYADAAPLARALIAANRDRVVWGTDWPHPGGGHGKRSTETIEPLFREDDGRALNRLAEWEPDPAMRARILVANPQRLYDFAGRA